MADEQRELEFILRFRNESRQAVNDAKKGMGGLNQQARQAKNEFQKFNKENRRTALNLRDVAVGVGTVVAAFAGLATGVDEFRRFEKGMQNVATLIPGQSARIKELGDDLRDLALASGTALDALSTGLFQTISALGDTEDTFANLQIANKAAIAGQADAKDAIELLTLVTKSYNITNAEGLQLVSDLAFTTNKLGVTTFPEMASAMGRVVPLAREMNISLEEMFGVVATLTGVTGNTNEVVTQFSSILSALLKPLPELEKVYAKLGVTTGKQLIEQKGFLGALEALSAEADNQGTSFTDLLGRKEAIIGVLPLLSSQYDNLIAKTTAMREATGATDEAFKEQAATLDFALNRIGRAIDEFQLQIGQVLAPALKFIGDGISFVTRVLRGLTPEMQEAIAAFATGSVVAAGLAAGITAIAVAFKALNFAIGTTPLGLLITAAGLATAAIVFFSDELGLTEKNLKSFFTEAGKFMTFFLARWQAVFQIAGTIVAGFATSLGSVIDVARAKLTDNMEFLSQLFTGDIKGAIETFRKSLETGFGDGIADGILDGFSKAGGMIANMEQLVQDNLDVLEGVGNEAGTAIGKGVVEGLNEVVNSGGEGGGGKEFTAGMKDFIDGHKEVVEQLEQELATVNQLDGARKAAAEGLKVYQAAIEAGFSAEKARAFADEIIRLQTAISDEETLKSFNEGIRDQAAAMEQELAVMHLVGAERERALLLMQLEHEARELGIEDISAQKEQLAALFDQMHAANTSFEAGLERGFSRLRQTVEDEAAFAEDLVVGTTGTIKREMKSLLTNGIKDFEDFADAVDNIIADLASRILDRQLDQIISSLFAGGSGGNGGGGDFFGSLLGSLGGLFGGGSGGGEIAFNPFHTGGIVDGTPGSRKLPAAVFANAARYHSGGLAGDEVPAVLRRGEGVFTPDQMAALGRGGNITVNIVNNAQAHVRVEDRGIVDGERQLEMTVENLVNRSMNDGRMDKTMGRNFGVGRAGVQR